MTFEPGAGSARHEERPAGHPSAGVNSLLRLWEGDTCDLAGLGGDNAKIFAAIQTEIIPRLLLVSAAPAAEAGRAATSEELPAASLSEGDRNAFVARLLGDSADAVTDFAAALLDRGVPVETLLTELFPWSARRLGELWDIDACTFSDVTIGLCRLHEVLHRLQGPRDPAAGVRGEAPSILIATVPDGQHIFGAVLAADIFRRAGWQVVCEPGADAETLRVLVKRIHFDAVGLSAATDNERPAIAPLIRALRSASRNPALKILAGGQLFVRDPGLAAEAGADAVAGEAIETVETARKLLART